MADLSHLEYCIKLGNSIIQNKLEASGEVSYKDLYNTYNGMSNTELPKDYKPPKRSEDIMNFRARLQNWNKQ